MSIDPAAEALLAKSEVAMLSLKSYSAECWFTTTYSPRPNLKTGLTYYQYAKLLAVKPNLMHYQVWGLTKDTFRSHIVNQNGILIFFFTCDGKRIFKQFDSTYNTAPYTRPDELQDFGEPWDSFYKKSSSLKEFLEGRKKANGKIHELALLPNHSVDGVSCQVVTYQLTATYDDKPLTYKGRFFIGPDGLIHRKEVSSYSGNTLNYTQEFAYRNIRKDFPQPSSQMFTYQPQAGVRPLLASGNKAPDFTVVDMNDKPVKLSDFKGKVVVIDFWATNCGPCIRAMPSTNKIAREFKKEKVIFLGVNSWEHRHPYRKWVKENQSVFESIVFVHDPEDIQDKSIATLLYSVGGIPTQFVVDRRGIVRASFVGFNPDETPLRNAIAAALKL